MTLNVKFGGPLVRFKPKDTKGNLTIVDCNDGQTITTLLDKFEIPSEQRLLVILNGAVVPTDAYSATVLTDDDDLSLMPPIQAG